MSETSSSAARLHAMVEGRVQGVGYRQFVFEVASMLQLKGWVRNRRDGSVEVLAEGSRDMLEKLLTALQRGPRMSYVTGLNPKWLPATGEFASFEVRMTI
jgi:acylphosphatase